MRLANVIMSLGLRIGMTDSRSNRIVSFFFWSISQIESGITIVSANQKRRKRSLAVLYNREIAEVLEKRSLLCRSGKLARFTTQIAQRVSNMGFD